MLTIEKILPKSIYTSGINELDFQFLLRRKYKDRTLFQTYFVKMIVICNSLMKKFCFSECI